MITAVRFHLVVLFLFLSLYAFSQDLWLNAQTQVWLLDTQMSPLSEVALGGKLGLEKDNFRVPNLDTGVFISAEYFLPVSDRAAITCVQALAAVFYSWNIAPAHEIGPYLNAGFGLCIARRGAVSDTTQAMTDLYRSVGLKTNYRDADTVAAPQLLGAAGVQYRYRLTPKVSIGAGAGMNALLENRGSYFNPEINVIVRYRLTEVKNASRAALYR